MDYIVPTGLAYHTFVYKSPKCCLPPEWSDAHIVSFSYQDGGGYLIIAVSLGIHEMDEKVFSGRGMTLVKHDVMCPTQHIQSLTPEPDYFYGYLPLIITCESCQQSFSHTELKEVEHYTDEYDIWFSQVCPHCDNTYPDTLTFETLADVMKECPELFK
jgi:hypothetical protein